MFAEILQMGPEIYVPFIIFSILITLAGYCAFPLLFAKFRKKTINKKSYKWFCYGVNFAIMFIFVALNGKSSGGPYLLWTSVFTAIGAKKLKDRGILDDDQDSDEIDTDSSSEKSIKINKNQWKDIESSVKSISSTFCPTMTEIFKNSGILVEINGGIGIDINNLEGTGRPLFESTLFVCGAFYAALSYYGIDSTEKELQKYVFAPTDDFKSKDFRHAFDDFVNTRKLAYSDVLNENIICGYSMAHLINFDFSGVKKWKPVPQIKCALLFCDFIACDHYLKEFCKIDDLPKLKDFIATENPDTKIFDKIYHASYSCAQMIFNKVGEIVNFVNAGTNSSPTNDIKEILVSPEEDINISQSKKATNVPLEPSYCRKCGKKLLPESEFCSNCGTKIITVTENN